MKRTLSSIHFGTIRGPLGKAPPQKAGLADLFGSAAPTETTPTPSSGKTKSSKKLDPKDTSEAVTADTTAESAPEEVPQIESIGITLIGKEGDTSVVPYNLGTLQEASSIQQVDLLSNVPRLPFLTKVAQIFQIAGFSDDEVWEGDPELFTVLSHFQAEIRASERYTETPIRVFMPKTAEFDGMECRDYQVDKTWPISKVIRIILKKFNVSSEEAAGYVLASTRDFTLDSERCLADYGLGSLFHSWQCKLTTKADIESAQAAQKSKAIDEKKAAGLKKLKSALESSAESKTAKSKTTKKSSSKSSSKSTKSEKSEKSEKSSKSKSSSTSDHSKSSTKDKSASEKASSPDESLAALAQSASGLSLNLSDLSEPKLPTLDLKGVSDSGKPVDAKLSPRSSEGRRTKSGTGSVRIRSGNSSNRLSAHLPPEGGSGDGDSDALAVPSDSPRTEKSDSKGETKQDDKKEGSRSHSRSTSSQTLQKKSSISSMTVDEQAASGTKEEEDGKKSGSSSKEASKEASKEGKESAATSHKIVKRRVKGESGKEARPKKKVSSKVASTAASASLASSSSDFALQSANLILDSLTMRPKSRSVPILLLLQQRELFNNDRVRTVKWSVNMTIKKLISAFLERQGQLSQAGHFVLCDLYGRALHPLATLETYGLDAKLPKWELVLVRRPDAPEVTALESLPLAAKYAWIKNKDVLPRIQLYEAKRIIIELDEKLHDLETRDIVSQYDAKCQEVETLKSEVSVLKESEKALTQMFSGLEKDAKKLSIETIAEEMKVNKKVATEALKAFEEAQAGKLALQRELEAERASRQADLKKATQNHATEMANLSDYSDALFAKNSELVGEMEEMRNEMFDQRQKAKQTEREKQAAREEADSLTSQLHIERTQAEQEKLQLLKQVELLMSQLEQAKARATQNAVSPVSAPIASQPIAVGLGLTHSHNTATSQTPSEYTSTPVHRTPKGGDEEDELVSELNFTSIRGIALRDGNLQVDIDVDNLEASTLPSVSEAAQQPDSSHSGDSDVDSASNAAQPTSNVDSGNESGLSGADSSATPHTEVVEEVAPTQVKIATPAPPPPPPPPPPAPSSAAEDEEAPEASKAPKLKLAARATPAATAGHWLDELEGMKSKLKQAPPREPPPQSKRNQVMEAIQTFSRDNLRHAAPIVKQVQEPEGLAKALYKRFVAMTDLMDVETLDDDEEDDWDTPSKTSTFSNSTSSLTSATSLSTSTANLEDFEEDEEDDIEDDFDQDDASDDGESDEDDDGESSYTTAHSRASSAFAIDQADHSDEEDSGEA
jgi:hypothetical protein